MTSTVLHAAAVFALLMVAIRAMGKREMAQMSPFDLIVLVIMGDVVAEAITSEDTSFTGATVVVATLVCLNVGLARIAWRWPGTRPALDGKAVVVLRDGVPDREAMNRERLSFDDLRTAARVRGIRRLDEVDLVVLETDGQFSFFTREDG